MDGPAHTRDEVPDNMKRADGRTNMTGKQRRQTKVNRMVGRYRQPDIIGEWTHDGRADKGLTKRPIKLR